MRLLTTLLLTGLLAAGLSVSTPASAQRGGASAPAETAEPLRRPRAKSQREPTAGQLAARERQKKCGVEWREAKAKGSTGGLKWPQYWSRCNARLKGGQA